MEKITANNMSSFQPAHPGELLKEEIEYRNISQREFARKIDISYTLLNEILNKKRPVNTEFALLTEAALGIEAEMLIKMQARYNLQIARTDKSLSNRLKEIRKIAAVL